MVAYRSKVEMQGAGFGLQLRAEWTKFRTVRGWLIALGTAALAMALLSLLGASGSHSGFCSGSASSCVAGHPPVPVGPGGEPVADSFTFVHRALVGDGSLTVRVTSLSGAHTTSNNIGVSASGSLLTALRPGLADWAKAGLILETGKREGSDYAAVMATGGHGVQMQYDYTHSIAGAAGRVAPSSPRWLRLVRTGDVIATYDSPDGAHWTGIGTARLRGLAGTVQFGVFVTSPLYSPNDSSNGFPSEATAGFDHLSTTGDVPAGPWRSESVGPNDIYPTLPGASAWQQVTPTSFKVSGSGDIAPLVGEGGIGNNAGPTVLVGALGGLIVLVVLATLFVTSEYRRGLIRTTFTATPARGRVLAAKALVIGGLAFAASLVGTAVGEVIGRRVLTSNGNYLFPVSAVAEARVVVGTALVLGVAAVLALALGTMFRRSAAAVVTGVVVLVLPFILATTLPPGASNWLMRLTPTAGFAVQATQPRSSLVSNAYTVMNGYYPLAPWAGFAVLCAYAAVALGAATWLLRRRDL